MNPKRALWHRAMRYILRRRQRTDTRPAIVYALGRDVPLEWLPEDARGLCQCAEEFAAYVETGRGVPGWMGGTK